MIFMSNWPDIRGNDDFFREIGKIFELFELFEYLTAQYSIFDLQLFVFESETLFANILPKITKRRENCHSQISRFTEP